MSEPVKIEVKAKRAPRRKKSIEPVAGETTATGRVKITRPQSYWWQLYEAADRRDFRGWFYLPKLAPSEQMDWLTYRAIVERSDWLYKNVGAVTMVIDTLSLGESGMGLWPKWITGQDDYDQAMTDAFHFTNHDPRFFSADAQQDFYSAQYSIRRMIRLYGDCFGQLLRPPPGAMTPLMNIIPGYLIENSGEEDPESGWTRGVLRDSNNRATFYRVRDSEADSGYTDIAAADLLHFHDNFVAGQIRGMPALSSVAKKMFRREDIAKAVANGTLAREQIAWAIETQSLNSFGPSFDLPGTTERETQQNADGSKFTVQKLFGWDAQEQTRVPVLPQGYKLVAAESNRPGTQVSEMQDTILRELAFSTGYAPQHVFFVAGLTQGTNVRLVVVKVREKIDGAREFQLKPQFINRWAVFFAWQRIKGGMFDALNIKVPDNWWKHKIVPSSRDLTVDLGREGRLYDERAESNKMSLDTYHGLSGEDSGDVEDENLGILERRLKKLAALNKRNSTTFTYFDIWPRSGSFARDGGAADPGSDTTPGKPGSNNETPGQPNGNGTSSNRPSKWCDFCRSYHTESTPHAPSSAF